MTNENRPLTDEELAEWEKLAEKSFSLLSPVTPTTALFAETRIALRKVITEVWRLRERLELAEILVSANRKVLTLPNGTRVQKGTWLVGDTEYDTAIEITGFGEESIVARIWFGEDIDDGYFEDGEGTWGQPSEKELLMHLEDLDGWKLWSEVYPDRPVPGIEKGGQE